MKIFLAERTDEERGCRVYLTFERAPKIVYLALWQYSQPIVTGLPGSVFSPPIHLKHDLSAGMAGRSNAKCKMRA